MSHEEILDEVNGFSLSPLEAYFFPDRIATDNVDWKIIAIEYHELAEAILNGREIEVDGTEGMKDVAAIYAIFESAKAGRTVENEPRWRRVRYTTIRQKLMRHWESSTENLAQGRMKSIYEGANR